MTSQPRRSARSAAPMTVLRSVILLAILGAVALCRPPEVSASTPGPQSASVAVHPTRTCASQAARCGTSSAKQGSRSGDATAARNSESLLARPDGHLDLSSPERFSGARDGADARDCARNVPGRRVNRGGIRCPQLVPVAVRAVSHSSAEGAAFDGGSAVADSPSLPLVLPRTHRPIGQTRCSEALLTWSEATAVPARDAASRTAKEGGWS
jgi:hypothetical protein